MNKEMMKVLINAGLTKMQMEGSVKKRLKR